MQFSRAPITVDGEVWIKIHKVDSGLKLIIPKEAIEKIETFVAMLKRGETIYPQSKK